MLPLRRVIIKEGCPLSFARLVLVYEVFHTTIACEFSNIIVSVCIYDIAIITPNKCEMQQVLACVHQLFGILGVCTNAAKTWLCCGSPPARRQGPARTSVPHIDTLDWTGKGTSCPSDRPSFTTWVISLPTRVGTKGV